MARAKKKQMFEPGYEGAVLIDSPVRITATRYVHRPLRCRPGTFEWRYGRKHPQGSDRGTSYEAGCLYALLWERAGTAAASSPGMEFADHGSWKGLPDGRSAAMDEIRWMFNHKNPHHLGKDQSARLTAYCVHGKTTSELASQYGIPDRDMAAVLDMDLRACAVHFRFR